MKARLAMAAVVLGTLMCGAEEPNPQLLAPGPFASSEEPDESGTGNLGLVVGTTMIQASHALFYGFGSIHWKNAGIGPDVIGFLWSEGVIFEIILFMFGAPILATFGPSRLIALAGLAGAVRWVGFGVTTELPALIILQTLHGMTFGAAHLAAMHFIQDRIAPEFSATAMSLYSSIVMGIGMGLAMLLSGYLYANHAGRAYIAMAIMAALGGVIIYRLRRGRR